MTDSKQRIGRVSFSSENDMKPLYFDTEGNRIAEVEHEPATRKPSYDIEVASKSPNYPERTHNEFHVYYNIHTEIAHFKTRTYFLGYLKAIRKVLMHKYLWRFL